MSREIVYLPLPSAQEREETKLIHSTVKKWTVPIIASTDEITRIGTAILFGIGDHLFAVSAGHCITDRSALITHLSDRPFLLPTPPTRVRHRKTHSNLDIGFIEIDNDLTLERCSLQSISTDKPAMPENPRLPTKFFSIAGFPHCMTSYEGHWMTRKYTSIRTHPVKISDADYMFAWGQKFRTESDILEETTDPAEPFGLSGAGLWLCEEPNGELFNPEKLIRLYGIEHACVDEGAARTPAIYCAPMIEVLGLIHDDYPDIRHLL